MMTFRSTPALALMLAGLAVSWACNDNNGINPNDLDSDGFTVEAGDCNDNNGAIYPDAPEPCDNADNNCNGQIDEGFDEDGDGFTTCGGDCRDNDPGSSPVQSELVDGLDNDCDGIIDNHTDQYDDDGDGFAEDQGDCDDSPNTGLNFGPNALEILQNEDGDEEGLDNDCDGIVDEAPLPCPTTRDLDDPYSYVFALDVCNEVSSASWSTAANTDPRARNIVSAFGDTYVPKAGDDMVVLSTGLAVDGNSADYDSASTDMGNSISHPDPQPDPGDGCGIADESTVYDYVELKLALDVPSNAKNFSFDFNFMSEEFPEYVCMSYDDTFLAWEESQAFTGNVSFDDQGNRVTINSGFFDVCATSLGSSCEGEAELAGTGYESRTVDVLGFPSPIEGGGTGWLTSTAPVKGGEKAIITFMLFDEGDHVLDSLVLIDNFRWGLDQVDDPITVERAPHPHPNTASVPVQPGQVRATITRH